MERLRNRIFTAKEANRLLPLLEQALDSLAGMAREAAGLRRELDVLTAIVGSGADEGNPDTRLLREKEEALQGLLVRFRAELDEVSGHGCIVRDLELGLVDFYTMAHDQVVCLCWRRGEPRIEHWHPLDVGFSGRRPLSELT